MASSTKAKNQLFYSQRFSKLANLPNDLILHIASFAPPSDIAALANTHKANTVLFNKDLGQKIISESLRKQFLNKDEREYISDELLQQIIMLSLTLKKYQYNEIDPAKSKGLDKTYEEDPYVRVWRHQKFTVQDIARHFISIELFAKGKLPIAPMTVAMVLKMHPSLADYTMKSSLKDRLPEAETKLTPKKSFLRKALPGLRKALAGLTGLIGAILCSILSLLTPLLSGFCLSLYFAAGSLLLCRHALNGLTKLFSRDAKPISRSFIDKILTIPPSLTPPLFESISEKDWMRWSLSIILFPLIPPMGFLFGLVYGYQLVDLIIFHKDDTVYPGPTVADIAKTYQSKSAKKTISAKTEFSNTNCKIINKLFQDAQESKITMPLPSATTQFDNQIRGQEASSLSLASANPTISNNSSADNSNTVEVSMNSRLAL